MTNDQVDADSDLLPEGPRVRRRIPSVRRPRASHGWWRGRRVWRPHEAVAEMTESSAATRTCGKRMAWVAEEITEAPPDCGQGRHQGMSPVPAGVGAGSAAWHSMIRKAAARAATELPCQSALALKYGISHLQALDVRVVAGRTPGGRRPPRRFAVQQHHHPMGHSAYEEVGHNVLLISRNRSRAVVGVDRSIALVGSSHTISRASGPAPLTRAMRCCWPPENSQGEASIRPRARFHGQPEASRGGKGLSMPRRCSSTMCSAVRRGASPPVTSTPASMLRRAADSVRLALPSNRV